MTELSKVVKSTKVATATKKELLEKFEPFFTQIDEWKKKADKLVITDPSQLTEMQEAGEARKALKRIRVDTENKRKELKEESLNVGRAIDLVANTIKEKITPIEKHLADQEKFSERIEAERKAKRKAERVAELQKYDVNIQFFDLENMPQEDYRELLSNSIDTHNRKLAEEEKARKEAEKARNKAEKEAKAEAKRQAAIEKENARLKKEAEKREAERQKEIEAEREKLKQAEEKARLERERIEKLEKAGIARQEELATIGLTVPFNECKRMSDSEYKELYEEQSRVYNEEQNRKQVERLRAEREEKRIAEELEAERKKAAEMAARIKEQQEQEERKKAEAMEAEKAAKLAPDVDKLRVLISDINSVKMPDLNDEKAKAIVIKVKTLLGKVTNFIDENIDQI